MTSAVGCRSDARKQVDGFPDAKYRRFNDLAAAKQWMIEQRLPSPDEEDKRMDEKLEAKKRPPKRKHTTTTTTPINLADEEDNEYGGETLVVGAPDEGSSADDNDADSDDDSFIVDDNSILDDTPDHPGTSRRYCVGQGYTSEIDNQRALALMAEFNDIMIQRDERTRTRSRELVIDFIDLLRRSFGISDRKLMGNK